jgi:hypothetical protein
MESKQVISLAAKLLRNEISQQTYNMDSYPTSCQVSDILKLKSWLLPLPLDFMNELIPDEVKQVAIGCSIAQAARPRFVMLPAQLQSWC